MRVSGVVVAVLAAACSGCDGVAPPTRRATCGSGSTTRRRRSTARSTRRSRRFKQLHVQEIRLNLYWGGKYGVATKRPAHATNPADPAYDWSLYDRTVEYAAQYGIHVLFSVYGTPAWANGGKGDERRADVRLRPAQLRATRPRKRYSGTYMVPDGQGSCRR